MNLEVLKVNIQSSNNEQVNKPKLIIKIKNYKVIFINILRRIFNISINCDDNINETFLMIEIINNNCIKQRKLKEQKEKQKRRQDILDNLFLEVLLIVFFIGLIFVLVIINGILFQ